MIKVFLTICEKLRIVRPKNRDYDLLISKLRQQPVIRGSHPYDFEPPSWDQQ